MGFQSHKSLINSYKPLLAVVELILDLDWH